MPLMLELGDALNAQTDALLLTVDGVARAKLDLAARCSYGRYPDWYGPSLRAKHGVSRQRWRYLARQTRCRCDLQNIMVGFHLAWSMAEIIIAWLSIVSRLYLVGCRDVLHFLPACYGRMAEWCCLI